MEINVLLTRSFFKEDISYLKKGLSGSCNLIMPEKFGEGDLIDLAGNAHIFLGGLISKALIEAAPELKFIQVPWTGVDGLNFKEIEELGVTVCNSHSNAYAVAEQAVALMFAVAKKIAYHDSELRKGNWNRPKPDHSNIISPFSKRISNAKVGIVGFGHIGKTIQKYLSGFGCQFCIVDANVYNQDAEGNCLFFAPEQMGKMLPLVGIVFICVPLTEQTTGMVNSFFISQLNHSAILINVSRGEVIDEDALYHALENSGLEGAGIDTWYNYPKSHDAQALPSLRNPFHELKNIVLSPHRSAFIEGELPHLDDAIININRAAEGLDPLNIISTRNKY